MRPRERKAGPESLARMNTLGGEWFAYENVDLSHPQVGHLIFLKCGEGCTFQEPPKPRAPDGDWGFGWRYYFVGPVSLETGIAVQEGG